MNFRVLRKHVLSLLAAWMIFACLPSGSWMVHAETEEEISYIDANYYSSTCGEVVKTAVPYSDSWFEESSDVYNHRLAQASIGLAVSVFRPSDENTPPEGRDHYARTFLTDAGFKDLYTCDYDRPSGRYTIANAIGHKEIQCGVETFELIAVGICGQGYNNEWLSNFAIGDDSTHEGFSQAAEEVYNRIFGYIAANDLGDKKIKVWISGFSRAAAVTNLLAASLSDSNQFRQEDIYAYTFACPAAVRDAEHGMYPNIFNIVGAADPVPMIPFYVWDYNRYGMTFLTPSQETDSDWYQKKTIAGKQYQKLTGLSFWNNLQLDVIFHTVMKYLTDIVPDAEVYSLCLEDPIMMLWNDSSLINILRILLDFSENEILINDENRDTVNELLDYLCTLGILAGSGEKVLGFWESRASTEANILHEHTPDVYLSWILSFDDPEELFCSNQYYSLISASGDVKVSVYENERAVFTADQNESGSAEGSQSVFASEKKGDTILIVVPEDRDYSIHLTSQTDQTVSFVRKCMATEDFLRQDIWTAQFDLKPDEEVILKLEGNETVPETNQVCTDRGTYADPAEQIMGRHLSLQKWNVLNLSWKQMVVCLLTAVIILFALLLYVIVSSVKVFRVSQRTKEGVLSSIAEAHLLTLLAVTTVFALYLVMEIFDVFYPDSDLLQICFRVLIAVLLILIVARRYRALPPELARSTAVGVFLLLAGDAAGICSPVLSLVLESGGALVLGIAMCRIRKPSLLQGIFFALICIAGLFPLLQTGKSLGLLQACSIVYYCLLAFVLALSFRLPERNIYGSILLLLSGIHKILSEVLSKDAFTNTVVHFSMTGLFVIGLVLIVIAPLPVSDLPFSKEPVQQ